MNTKITVIYDNPLDPEAFDLAYPSQLAKARTVPGVLAVESSKVWPKEDGTAVPAYRLLDLTFADYESASAAVQSDAAAALFGGVIENATGGVRIVFTYVDDSWTSTT